MHIDDGQIHTHFKLSINASTFTEMMHKIGSLIKKTDDIISQSNTRQRNGIDLMTVMRIGGGTFLRNIYILIELVAISCELREFREQVGAIERTTNVCRPGK